MSIKDSAVDATKKGARFMVDAVKLGTKTMVGGAKLGWNTSAKYVGAELKQRQERNRAYKEAYDKAYQESRINALKHKGMRDGMASTIPKPKKPLGSV
jgi:hypothetical protein